MNQSVAAARVPASAISGLIADALGTVGLPAADAAKVAELMTEADLTGFRPATERYALLLANRAREKLGATWGLGETGAAGPTGNRYGDAAGHACIAVAGPASRSMTVETGIADRAANMRNFAAALLTLMRDALEGAPG